MFPKEVQWRGESYPTPSDDMIQFWVFDSVCETPEGDIVEPDHPDHEFVWSVYLVIDGKTEAIEDGFSDSREEAFSDAKAFATEHLKSQSSDHS